MKILTINCGSSTLKFQFIEVENKEAALGQEHKIAFGIIDRIGSHATIQFTAKNGEYLRETAVVSNHFEATQRVLSWLGSLKLLGADGLEAVGHRVVHGGDRFTKPTLINDEVIHAIEGFSDLAPLHNAPSLSAIRAVRALLGSNVPQVATFDTVFHTTLPERASRYAIPLDIARKHHIRRYGFHGLAHRYMTERYAAITHTSINQLRIITLQLGNGCSATAIKNGHSVDTSMGFTPLEGLMMGTRSGDVDPSLTGFLARQEEVNIEEVEDWLNTRSGLLGVSGRSQDMRELLETEAQGNSRAALSIEMFCYRVRKYIGAYMAVLGGVDAVVFGGGIGENAPTVRDRICADMDWCGLNLDQDRNAAIVGSEGRISVDDAKIHAYVIPVNEAVIIARDTVSCLHQQR